jgi:alpha-ketoglutarate-dependent taurine dioxygenase
MPAVADRPHTQLKQAIAAYQAVKAAQAALDNAQSAMSHDDMYLRNHDPKFFRRLADVHTLLGDMLGRLRPYIRSLDSTVHFDMAPMGFHD